MCCNTKQKIAQALRELMIQRSLNKITVQDLMQATQMKRQSFYYHFQDIYDVLVWTFEQQLGQPLREDPDLDFEDWCLRAMALVREDKAFYRRAFTSANPALLLEFCEGLVKPRMCQLLYPGMEEELLSPEEDFVVVFYTKAVVNYFVEHSIARKPLDLDAERRYLHGLLEALRPQNAGVSVKAG